MSHKITIIFILSVTTAIFSQEKLKGNGVVTSDNRSISEFSKIEVIDNVEVFLIYNNDQSVTIETDSNIQDAILTIVKDGILTIKTNKIIGRNKALKAHIKVNKNITEISAYNGVNIISENSIIIDSLTINAFDSSVIKLKLNSKDITINAKSDSNLDLEILSTLTTINTEGTNTTVQ